MDIYTHKARRWQPTYRYVFETHSPWLRSISLCIEIFRIGLITSLRKHTCAQMEQGQQLCAIYLFNIYIIFMLAGWRGVGLGFSATLGLDTMVLPRPSLQHPWSPPSGWTADMITLAGEHSCSWLRVTHLYTVHIIFIYLLRTCLSMFSLDGWTYEGYRTLNLRPYKSMPGDLIGGIHVFLALILNHN